MVVFLLMNARQVRLNDNIATTWVAMEETAGVCTYVGYRADGFMIWKTQAVTQAVADQ